MVKHLSTMQETWVRSLSQEDSLEKGMAIHSSIVDNILLYYKKCKLSFFQVEKFLLLESLQTIQKETIN